MKPLYIGQLVQRLRWELAVAVTLSTLPFLTVMNLRVAFMPATDKRETKIFAKKELIRAGELLKLNSRGRRLCVVIHLSSRATGIAGSGFECGLHDAFDEHDAVGCRYRGAVAYTACL